MKHELEFKGLEPTQKMRSLIDKKLGHLNRLTQRLRGDSLFLRCVVEEVPVHKLIRVALHLEAPNKTLFVRQESHDAEAAIRDAFQEIEKQIEAYKSTLRGEQWWKRMERRRQLRLLQAGVVPAAGNGSDDGTQEFFALVEPHLEKLREIAGRVLRYVESRGDLQPGDVELDDIVDKALVRAYDQLLKGRSHEDIRSRLIKFALDEIKAAVKRARTDRGRAVHIEDEISDTLPGEEVSTLGDEILDFYQPDEDLTMEDVIPDLNVPTPEEIVETEELRSCVRDALRGLPRDAQRALTLRYIIGLRGEELAKSLRKPQAEAEHLVDNARAHLREKLIAVGCTVKTLAG